MWTCPNCAEQNDDGAQLCAVCATRPVSEETGSRPPGTPSYPAPADPWAPSVAGPPPSRPAPVPPRPATPPTSGAPGGPAMPSVQATPFGPDPATPAPAETTSYRPPPSEPFLEPSPSEPFPAPPPSETFPAPPPSETFPGAPRSEPFPGPPGSEPFPGPPADQGIAGRPFPVRWIVGFALLLLVGVGVAAAIVVPRLLSNSDDRVNGTTLPAPSTAVTTPPATTGPTDPDPTDPATTDPTSEPPTTEAPTTGAPTAAGSVAIDPGLTDDRAPRVAAMFDTYFSGINHKDYSAVRSVLDPAGSVDPNNRKQMDDLAKGTQSTTDSDVVLTDLGPLGGGLLTAEVTFQSNQDPGDGPRGRSGETCTRWDIHYTVSGSDGAYRIRKSRASSKPC